MIALGNMRIIGLSPEPTAQFGLDRWFVERLHRRCQKRFFNVIVAHFPGFATFNGRILHAHDFRDAMEFKGRDILIIGTSYSAEDIGSQCWKYGCKSVTVSYRTAPMGFHFPDNWEQLPLLEKVEGNTATFKDGSRRDVDAIILCTGYLHHFPFLPDDLRLITGNRMWPLGLYKGVAWEHHKHADIMGFRNNAYRSLMTGTMAPVHHTPWRDAMDDSAKSYLQIDVEAAE